MPRDEGYLLYMLFAARRVVHSTANVARSEFDSDDEKRDSVVLQLGNIGEAASKVSPDFQRRHPGISWRQIINMRHRLFHEYEKVNWDRVWEAAVHDVPALIRLIEPLIPPEDSL